MSRIDIMCDLETLGTKADSTIIQIAAIAFDIYGGKELSFFDKTVDLEKCKKNEHSRIYIKMVGKN